MEIAAIIFILIMIAVAWIVFRLLKRVAKMAVRAIIVLILMLAALAGGFMLWNANAADIPITTKTSR